MLGGRHGQPSAAEIMSEPPGFIRIRGPAQTMLDYLKAAKPVSERFEGSDHPERTRSKRTTKNMQ
jgi:hypothetical protein